jgi:hypothetical protein
MVAVGDADETSSCAAFRPLRVDAELQASSGLVPAAWKDAGWHLLGMLVAALRRGAAGEGEGEGVTLERKTYLSLWKRLRRMSMHCESCGRLHYMGPVRLRKKETDPRNINYCLPCLRRLRASWDAKPAPASGSFATPMYWPQSTLSRRERDECKTALEQLSNLMAKLHVSGNNVCKLDDPGEHTSSWSLIVRGYEGDDVSLSAEDRT